MLISNNKISPSKKIIIEGVTKNGESFRPSDWVERVCGSLATFDNCHMTYSPLLQPVVRNGYKCLILDSILKETNPEIYKSIMRFVDENKLKMYTCI